MTLLRTTRLIFALALLSLLTACVASTPGASSDGAADGSAAEKQQVSMWVGTTDTADCVIKVAVDSFNEKSSGVAFIHSLG